MQETPEKYQSREEEFLANVCRVPSDADVLVRMGSHVFVRDDEVAVLRVGEAVADVLGPGTHVLSTRSIPLATRSLCLPYGSGSSFQGVFYFLKKDQAVTQRWGTPRPVAFHDNMFGIARVRAHGTVTMEISNPRVFLRTSGDDAVSHGLGSKLCQLIASRFTDALAERVDTLIDLERYRKELRRVVLDRIERDFALRGMRLLDFSIDALTLPREVMATIESRGAVGSVRQLRDFMRIETTRALGSPVAVALDNDVFEPAPLDDVTPVDQERSSRCNACHVMLPDEADFCVRCGQPLENLNPCLACDAHNPLDAVFCMRCGEPMGSELMCGECSSPSPHGARYCRVCGNSMNACDEAKQL